MRLIVANLNTEYKSLNQNLKSKFKDNVQFISRREDLNLSFLEQEKPDFIFFPHWSYIIPENIFNSYNCIVFHMTDLPYGRGGSPLQNLILRGHKKTVLSALKVDKGIDTGDIYLKKELSLNGNAREIFQRTGELIEEMIYSIIDTKSLPTPQKGIPVIFNRRNPEESDISKLTQVEEVYNYIRMLDADGYPQAFLETNHFKFEFTESKLENNKTIIANVRITKK